MNKFLLFIGFISCYIVQASNNFDIDNNDLDEMQFGSFHTSLGSFFDSDDESEPSDDMEQNIVVPKTKKLPVTPEEIRIHKEQQAKALAEERKRKEIGTYDAVSRCVHQFFTYGAKSYKGIGYSDFFKKYQNEVDAFLASLAEDHSVMLPAYIVEDIHDELSIKQRQNINLPSEIVENGQWQQVMKYYKIVGIMPSTFRTKDQKGK